MLWCTLNYMSEQYLSLLTMKVITYNRTLYRLCIHGVADKQVLPVISANFNRACISTVDTDFAQEVYRIDCQETATDGTWCDMWHIHGLASLPGSARSYHLLQEYQLMYLRAVLG